MPWFSWYGECESFCGLLSSDSLLHPSFLNSISDASSHNSTGTLGMSLPLPTVFLKYAWMDLTSLCGFRCLGEYLFWDLFLVFILILFSFPGGFPRCFCNIEVMFPGAFSTGPAGSPGALSLVCAVQVLLLETLSTSIQSASRCSSSPWFSKVCRAMFSVGLGVLIHRLISGVRSLF